MSTSAAIRTPRTGLAELDYRPSYRAAAVASGLVMLLYLVTLSPSTAMWDTSEYIAAAYIMGIPHPPGNPLFVLIGRVFSMLPIAPNVAMRINILAALSSAISAGMWFLIAERVLVAWLPRRWQRIAGGSLAALIGATAFTVWAQSVVNEKVYTVSLVGMAISAWLIVRWCDEPTGRRADRLLVLVAYLSGLGYANHMAGFLVLPAFAIALAIRQPARFAIPVAVGAVLAILYRIDGIPKALVVVLAIGALGAAYYYKRRVILAAAAALALGMTPYATQPIRAAYFPAINEGEPTGCETQIGVDCTFSQLTWQRFKYNFDREQYGKPALAERQAPLSAQVGMWWLYFKWQWLRDHWDRRPGAQTALAVIFLFLGGLGGYVHWRRDRRSFWFFGPLIFTVTFVLIYYMNFKYGYSQAPELGDSVPREVRDRDYFYLWSFSTWSVWAALGLVWVWESLAALLGADEVRLGNEVVTTPRKKSWLAASPVLGLALIPLFANWDAASRRGEHDTANFARDLLNSVEPYGILITAGDNDTFPLWYAQEVEGVRQDVMVANTSLLNTDWYTRQLIRQPVREYDAERGPAIYRGREWPKPKGPPVNMTFAEADAVPLAIELREPQIFRKEGTDLSAVVRPRDVGYGALGLTRADLFVLYMVRDAFPERPVFFSRTTGAYAEELGFGSNVLGAGLARKLLLSAPTASDSIRFIPGDGWFDLPTSQRLWTGYEAPDEITRRGYWVDKPSANIPYLYIRSGFLLAQALYDAGREDEAHSVYEEIRRIAVASGLGETIPAAPPRPSLPLGADTPPPGAETGQ
ncbi:MAG TPA: DUF2723 domain-containing protein [Gemmatimonadaceae bacterium]|nr:DUF2723 domain-containing protein [Gemmatimonadaceae bacterium]